MNYQDDKQRLIRQNSQIEAYSDPLSDNVPSFLLKTYQILENQKFYDIISWTKNGEGFIVKKVKQFSQSILPIYFRHSNYTSFVRQLNMYDFHKTRQQNQENAFKNFMFKKGQKYLLKQIQRKDYKKNRESTKQLLATQQLGFVDCLSSKTIKPQALLQNSLNFNNGNLNQLKKVKLQLQQKSLKLMSIQKLELTPQMVIHAAEALFQCSSVISKGFLQLNLFRNEYLLNRQKSKQNQLKNAIKMPNQQKYLSNKKQNRAEVSGFKQPSTQARSVFGSQMKPSVGFQKIKEGTSTSLFNSFRND